MASSVEAEAEVNNARNRTNAEPRWARPAEPQMREYLDFIAASPSNLCPAPRAALSSGWEIAEKIFAKM
jgi:hypothetical protein